MQKYNVEWSCFEEGKMLVKTKLLILYKKGKLIKSPFSGEKCYNIPPHD